MMMVNLKWLAKCKTFVCLQTQLLDMMMVNQKWLAKRNTIVLALIATKLINLALVRPKWLFAIYDGHSAYVVTHKLIFSESQQVLEENL